MPLSRLAALIQGIFLLLAGTSVRAQVVAHAGNDITICAGDQVTLGGAPATGGTGPYTYSWAPATGLANANTLHPTCSATSSQTYNLTATDANGLSGTDQVVVTVKPAPTINLSSPDPIVATTTYNGVLTFSICGLSANSYAFTFNDASTGQVGATYSITWGNGQSATFSSGGWTSTQAFPLGLTAGSYTVTNPAPNGCSRTIPFNVFLGEVPLGGLSVVSNSTICTGDSISFAWNNFGTNPPGTLYIVNYGDGVVDTLQQPPQATFWHHYAISSCTAGGEFNIQWRISNPCDTRTGQIGQIRVSESPLAAFTMSPGDTACVNTTVTFSHTGQGQQAPNCTDPKHIWAISPAAGWTASGALGSTNGQPATPSLWTTGASSLGVTFTTPGTYTITDITANMCGSNTLARTICVEAPPQPAFTLSPATGCTPLVGTVANASTSPNSCQTRYHWLVQANSASCGGSTAAIFSGGTNADSFAPQFTFTGAGSYTATLQAINSCGTFPVNQSVSVGAPPQVALNPITGICAGQTVAPSATFSPCGTPITGYGWALPGGAPATAATQVPGTITYPAPGTFTITATASSACGSTNASTTLSVGTLPAAPVVGGPISLCAGETLNLAASGQPGVTYQWTGPNGFTAQGSPVSMANVSTAAAGVYVVTASSGGCPGPPSTIAVTVNPPLVVAIAPLVPTVCTGNPITLTASGASTYQWVVNSFPVSNANSFTFTPTATSTVVLTGSNGVCTGSTSTQVTVYPLPVVNAGPDRVFCEGSFAENLFPVTLGGVWSGDPAVSPNGHFTPLVQGIHQLAYTVVSPQGCPATDTVQVTVGPPATPANAGPDTLLCQNSGPLQLHGSPAQGIWNGDISIGGLFTPSTAGQFVVHYTTGIGSCASTDTATITVVPATPVNPGPDQQLCIDAPAFALNASPAGGTWSGSGVAGSAFSPQAAGAGTHNLQYVYADPNGCITTAGRTITVHPLPVVQAGNDTTFCDQPFALPLAGFSPVGGAWSGPGVSPAGAFTPNGPGTFNLTYVYTDLHGCSASDSLLVTVIPITNPAMAGNDTAVCVGAGVLQLAGAPGGGTWSGPYVDPFGAFDPAQAGVFTVTYQVGTGSCITHDQLQVTVHALPVLNIASVPGICIDAGPQTLAATPAGGTWSGTGITDAAQGTFDPAQSGAGTFAVQYAFTDGHGCYNAVSVPVTVHPLPVAAFSSDTTACTGVAFPFTDATTGASTWQWDFGDGGTSGAQFPTHIFTNPGTFTVTLAVASPTGCTDTIAHQVAVWEGPSVAFNASPSAGCGPLLTAFDNLSQGPGVSYAWDFGDGTSSTLEEPGQHTYGAGVLADTLYTVVLTATNFCASVQWMDTITVHPSPTALFGPDFDSGCSPWPVTFSNVTVGQADSFHWDFGDGLAANTTDSLVHHTYYTGTSDTTYTITLSATNSCGTDSASYTITVLPNTITAFFNTDTTSGCAPLTVAFTQYSIGATHWHWDLGDGNVSNAQNVVHTYTTGAADTTYIATLYADNGCSYDTVSVPITVHAVPAADFAVAPGLHCAGTAVQFTNNTPAPAGLHWDFGDGGTSTLSAPAHAYAAAGNYTVTLAVASTVSPCPAMATQLVHVAATPNAVATASPASGCIPLDVQFNLAGSSATDFQQWDFGDGNTSGAAAPAHAFTGAGTYTIRLVAENLSGCTDTAFTSVTAFPLPASSFTMAATQSCTSPATLPLTSTATGAISHFWDFGNGTTSLLNNPVAMYQGPGTYTITLVVANPYGCTDTSSGPFIVQPTPIAQFTAAPLPACAGYPVHFTNGSLNSSLFQWTFGDGEHSSMDNPTHIYQEGDYDVMLIATGAGGCTDTLVVADAVHVNPRPMAAFSYTPMLSTSYALQFHNESAGAVQWLWHFGDGDSSAVFEPLHLYPAGPHNLYPLCLVAINTFGCPDTLCRPVAATSDPNIFAPNAFTPDHDGLNETFLPALNGFEDWRYGLAIFNRWGQLIFDSHDRHAPWDATFQGKPVEVGVYVWRVTLNREGDERVYYGHVTVVRGTE